MRSRRLLAGVVAIAAAAVVAGVLILTMRGGSAVDPRSEAMTAPAPPTSTPAAAPTKARARTVDGPDRVRIQAIGVDADVIGVGTAADNSQEVPTSLSEAGWWEDGRKPGQDGNAVVVGHTASRDDGVFDRLGEVERGDVVTVSDGADDLEFRVTKIDDVPVEDFGTVADDVYRTSGPRGLVLMTCGDWNGKTFESTVIVHATAA